MPASKAIVSCPRFDFGVSNWVPTARGVQLPLNTQRRSIEVDPTAQIWKGLFEDSRFNSGVITVSGRLVSQGGKSSNGPMFTLSCNRSDAQQIDWDTVDAHGIQGICTFDQLIQSL